VLKIADDRILLYLIISIYF